MTDPDRQERVKAILDAALDLDPAARAAFVSGECADDATLLEEVRSLLEAVDRTGDPLERPLPQHSELGAPALEGTLLGSYRLLRRVGAGGMGVVYEAERADEQFDRRVAIKLLHGQGHSEDLIRRFRQERQILASLAHPNIVSMLDAGVTGDGRLFLVMEYVEGERIDVFSERRGLTTEQRIDLFRQVCAAVQFAHQNLVVHRDLKPGNILVTPDGVVKLLDFGVAKIVSPGADPDRTVTEAGARAFTPAYASPEQLRGEAVTVLSDIYALGVVLYEILAGRGPYAFRGESIFEMERIVSSSEPTLPSAALAQGGPAGVAPGVRAQELRGDLDQIILTAIRKEPERRYPSAAQLGEDLRRFLSGRPVLAQPDTLGYRARKFVRRHRSSILVATVGVVALTVGLSGAVVQRSRARLAQARAEQQAQDVRRLVGSLVFDVHDAISELPGSTEARALLLDRAYASLEGLALDVGGDPALEWEVAEALLRLGIAQGQPAGASLGDLSAAARSYEKGIELARAAVAGAPAETRYRRTLAVLQEQMGDALAFRGEVGAGVGLAQEALSGYATIAQAAPDSARHALSVVISLVKLGDLTGNPNFPNLGLADSARAIYATAELRLATYPLADNAAWGVRRFRGLVQERIGTLARLNGDLAAARAAFEVSLSVRRQLADEAPTNVDAVRDVGVAYQNLCEVEAGLGDLALARSRCELALETYAGLHVSDTSNAQGLTDLALGHRSLAGVLDESGEVESALDHLSTARDWLLRRLELDASDVRGRLELARAEAYHSLLARSAGRPAPFATDAEARLSELQAQGLTAPDDLVLLERLGTTER